MDPILIEVLLLVSSGIVGFEYIGEVADSVLAESHRWTRVLIVGDILPNRSSQWEDPQGRQLKGLEPVRTANRREGAVPVHHQFE